MMDTKAAFEKWALSTYDLTESALVSRAYTNERTENAWRIWQESWYQSRAEIDQIKRSTENFRARTRNHN